MGGGQQQRPRKPCGTEVKGAPEAVPAFSLALAIAEATAHAHPVGVLAFPAAVHPLNARLPVSGMWPGVRAAANNSSAEALRH